MRYLILIFSFVLASCVPTSSNYYKNIDTSKKVISMPVTNKYLGRDLKDLFRKNGWQIIILDTGTLKTTGSSGDNTSLDTNFKSKARYITYLRQNWRDICGIRNDKISFDLTIADSKTGEEVFVASGEDCEKTIVKDLEEQLSKFWN